MSDCEYDSDSGEGEVINSPLEQVKKKQHGKKDDGVDQVMLILNCLVSLFF